MASFLSTLFGGGAEADAANADRLAAAQYQSQAQQALQTGYGTGTGALQTGYGTGVGALGTGYAQGQQALQSAIGAYTPLANLGAQYSAQAQPYYGQNTAAINMALNAEGVNGPQNNAAAISAFQSTPGMQAMLDNAAQAAARTRGAANMGASGNANIDQILGAAGITGQQYQNWMNNLGTTGTSAGSMANALAGMGLSATGQAAGGQAAGYGNLANLASTYGGNVANLAGTYGQNVANLASNYGQNQASLAGNVMSTDVGANNLQAAGEAAGAKNLLGAGLSLATLGMGGNPFGGSLTGGSSGSSGGFGSSLIGQGLTGLKSLFS